MNVIVLDGNQRSALAVTRSLGIKGIKVTVGAETKASLSSYSKYCDRHFSYPSPNENPEKFIEKLKDYLACESEAIILPMTDVTLNEILRKRDDFADSVKIPFVDYDKYMAVTDKVNLFTMARELDIPIPRTIFPSECKNSSTLIEESRRVGFPLVVKSAHSKIRTENGWINGGVRYARDGHELRAVLNEEPFKSFPFIIQERIEGPGVGIFLLMQDGEIIAQFAHRRIREKPPSGGVSVLCESIEPPPIALNAAIKLLQHLNWFGVAMVEFKWDRHDNMPKLMEVNARFWGSLELAISTGIDFPYLQYCISIGQKVKIQNNYKIGLKLRWELGDLDHLFIRLKKKKPELFLPPDALSRIKVLKNFIVDFFSPSIRKEVFKPNDPRPFLFELKQYIKGFKGSRF